MSDLSLSPLSLHNFIQPKLPENVPKTGKNSNWYFVCPPKYAQDPQEYAPAFPQVTPEILFHSFVSNAKHQPRVTVLLVDQKNLRAQFCQKSLLIGYPDYITLEVMPCKSGATFAIWSRSKYGIGDFNVNRKRIRLWIGMVKEEYKKVSTPEEPSKIYPPTTLSKSKPSFSSDSSGSDRSVNESKTSTSNQSNVDGIIEFEKFSLPNLRTLRFLTQRVRQPGGFVVKDRKYHFKKYPNCFVGSEAVDVLLKITNASTRAEAVSLGNHLLSSAVISHVCEDHTFKDGYLFYQFNDLMESSN